MKIIAMCITTPGFWADNGHFKVLETKGLWQPQWGTDDGSTVRQQPRWWYRP